MVESPICDNDVPISKTVSCRHGHVCCERDHLEFMRGVYEIQGTASFRDLQRCFECGVDLPDYRFSEGYFRDLSNMQVEEISRARGVDLDLSRIHTLRDSLLVQNAEKLGNAQRKLREFYDASKYRKEVRTILHTLLPSDLSPDIVSNLDYLEDAAAH